MYLRATHKVLRRLPPRSPEGSASDSALGDWYVNRLVLNRQPLLILVSESSLLPILECARDVRSLPERLPGIVRRRLERLDVEDSLIEPEVRATHEVLVAGTVDRSVVGTMVDFSRAVPYYLPEDRRWNDAELRMAEAKLATTPCRSKSRDTLFPNRDAPARLRAKWLPRPDNWLTSSC